MTLPASGTMTAAMINTELGRTSTAAFNINGASERALAGKASGAIAFSDFYGKSSTPVYTPNWANILSDVTGPSSVTASNAAQTVNSGTLTISHNVGGTGAFSWKVFKNGADQGADTSVPVADGDSIYFQCTLSGFDTDASGTFTISGAESDTFTVTLSVGPM